MIIVKIELWPWGFETRKRMLGEIHISNDGTGDRDFGNYDVGVKHGGTYWGKEGYWKEGKVHNHARSLSPYHLVMKALQNCLGGRR